MSRQKIRHLVAKRNRAGTVRWYWQPSATLAAAGWKTKRLADERGAAIAEAEALNRQADALRGAAGPRGRAAPAGRPETVAQLIGAFKRHRFYLETAPRTRRFYDQNLAFVERWAGDKPVLAIDRALVEALYESLRHRTPARARAIVTALRRLYTYARIPYGAGLANPAEKPGLRSGRRTPARLWALDELDAVIAAADAAGWPSVGDAVAAAWWLGQRQGDILALRRDSYVDGAFRIVQRKTGAVVETPHAPALAARLEAALERQRRATVESPYLVLHETTHRPWQEDTFRHAFAQIRAAAAEAMPSCGELLFRHLRQTAVTQLHHAGCDPMEIATITGHTLKAVDEILDVYFVRTAETAARAAKKRLAWERKQRRKERGRNGA